MAKKIRKICGNLIINLLTKWLEDLLIFAGIAVIIGTTYEKFGTTIGNYSLGLVLLIFGFLIAKK